MPEPRPLRFTRDDAERAFDDWGCNCGPAALAATLGWTLDEVRTHLGDFAAKGYVNPTLMQAALRSTGAQFSWRPLSFAAQGRGIDPWPDHGLARVQWEGPWTKPGVPMPARYRHTHWVAACRSERHGVGIFDINTMLGNGPGWCSLADWSAVIVPAILAAGVPRADGRWHLTHIAELRLLPAPPNG